MDVRAHVFVSGMVQGVGFRWYTTQQARAHGVGGFVRNLCDGRVEAVFEGAEDAVKALVTWCEHGPRHASVSGVEVAWEQPEGVSGFGEDF